MKISPDALALSVVWAKAFQPWLWDFKANRWNPKSLERGRALLLSNQEQLQYALESGYSPCYLRDLLTRAKREKRVVRHVYTLIYAQATLEPSGDLLVHDGTYVHRALYDGMLQRASFTLEDLVAYARRVLPEDDETRRALRILVSEHGLDRVLFALDAAASAEALRSPWGLKWHFAQADIEIAARRARLHGLAMESAGTRGMY